MREIVFSKEISSPGLQRLDAQGVATPAVATAKARLGDAGREFLVFKIDGEEYGIDILHVMEIRSHEPPLRIANAPDFVTGVVNLRGVIVPLVDMRLKFGLPSPRHDSFTVEIVLGFGARLVGIVVDSVCDVVTLAPYQMLPVPEFNTNVAVEHLLAIGSLDERMLILMDIESLMASPGMGIFSSMDSTLSPALAS